MLEAKITSRFIATIEKSAADSKAGSLRTARARNPRGTTEALARLKRFVRERHRGYASNRNHPELDATSRLSPYLYFGQIGPHTIVVAILKAAASSQDRAAFLEELMIRRELAINF